MHIKLPYFTIQLQSSTHITYYLHINQKDLKLNLDRAIGKQPFRISYLLRVTTELIGNDRDLADGKVYWFSN
jgi:hypothetical protein